MGLVSERSDLLLAQIRSLQRNIESINTTAGPIDCSSLEWVSPLTSLPLAATIYDSSRQVTGCNLYLKTIGFPSGVDNVVDLSQNRTYLPMVRFPNDDPTILEQLTDGFSQLVLRNLSFQKNIHNAWHYAIGELVTNICEHSKSRFGWLFAQYYPNKEFLDFVVLDRGQGFRGIYESVHKRPYTDQEAIRQALRGHSAKDDKERGYGVHTTRNLVVGPELKGKFLILSGGCGYYVDSERETWLDLESWSWQGAIVMCRIFKTEQNVDITKYVES